MTTDVKAAEAFYAAVVGWRPEAFGGCDMNYTVMNAADRGNRRDDAAAPRKPRRWALRPPGSATSTPKTSTRRPPASKKAGGKVHRTAHRHPRRRPVRGGRRPARRDVHADVAETVRTSRPPRRNARPYRLARALCQRLEEAPSTSMPASSAGPRARRWTWARWVLTSCSATGPAP